MRSPKSVAESFQVTLDLFETGVALMRQNLRRRHQEVDEREIDALMDAWLVERPGAKGGDAEGTPVDFLSGE
jgi:hypothetical protein